MDFIKALNYLQLESLTSVYPYKGEAHGIIDTRKKIPRIIDYSFDVESGDEINVEIYITLENSIYVGDVSFSRNGSTEVTNEGKAFKIFATVLSIIKEVMNEYPLIKEYVFTAEKSKDKDESSRSSLYIKLVNKYIDKNLWNVEIKDRNSEIYFSIKEKES